MKIFLQIIFGISLLLNIQLSFAQSFTGATKVTSAVPFLTISPDAKAGAMGESGAATQPDVFSQFWNPAKYPFIENSIGISYSFSPWLRALVQDINLTNIVGYFKLGESQVISSSLKYFGLGSIEKYYEIGEPLETINPNEFAFDIGYSRKLSDNFLLRYI